MKKPVWKKDAVLAWLVTVLLQDRKQWQGAELDRLARLHMKRKPAASYRESLTYVLKRNPRLARRYNESLPRDPMRDLKRVADTLNNERTPGLRPLLAPVISPHHFTQEEIDKAALELIGKFSELRPRWRYFTGKKRVVFRVDFPETILGLIARAFLSGDLSTLKCCPYCNDFFVDPDHRKEYHVDCHRRKEAERSKINREKAHT
jgi:hypothetical protein